MFSQILAWPIFLFALLSITFLSRSEELFKPSPASNLGVIPTRSLKTPGKRSRLVSVNTNVNWFGSATASPASSTVLNLFDDVTVTAVLESATSPGPGRTVLRGRVAGENGSYFLLATESNIVFGSVFIPNRGSWRVEYAENGLHRIVEEDPAQVPPCGVESSGPGVPPPNSLSPSRAATTKASSGGATFSIVDVLVLYTPQARDGAGGEAAMDTLIDLAVAEANLTYRNSGVNLILRLAGTAKVPYQDSGNISLDLSRLINPADGYLDEVGALRTACNADLVCLLVENSDTGLSGVATVTANRTNAFSVVQRSWAVGSYVFAHELGHNFGCQHDKANANTAGAYSFSYGWVFQANFRTYGTVMSYPGQRIPHFSNPSVDFLGVPTGTSAANNAQTLSLTMATVSAFSGQGTTTKGPGISLASPINNSTVDAGENLILTANVTAGSSPVTRVDFYQDGTLIGSSTGPVFSCQLTNLAYGDFSLTGRAVDGIGASTLSSPVTVRARYLNDSFALRRPFTGTDVQVGVGNVGATLEPGEPVPFAQADATVWLSWTAPADGTVLFSLPGHDFPAFAAVYTGNVLTNLQFVSGSPDGLPTAFPVQQGVTYQIAIGGYDYSTVSGHATLQWQEFPSAGNDNFAAAIQISGTNYHVSANNVMATAEPGEPSHGLYAQGHSVWWQWIAPTNGVVSISTSNGQDVIAAAYLGDSISNLTTVADGNPQVQFSVAAGRTYDLAVDNRYGGYSAFDLDLAFSPGVNPPSNDDFADSISVAGSNAVVAASNIGATKEPGEPGKLTDYYTGSGQSVWYSWTAPQTGFLIVDSGRDDAYIAAYTGDTITELTYAGSIYNKLSISVMAGVTYHILLDSRGSPFQTPLAFSFRPSINDLSNDNFTNRAVLTGSPAQVYQFNGGATKEPGEPNHGGNPGGQSLWYTWTSTFDGPVLIKVESQAERFYSLLGVYTGDTLTNLQSVGQGSSQVQLAVTNGMTLQIAVDGYNGFYGIEGAAAHYILTVQGPPANDNFDGRQTISGTNIFVKSSNLLASKEPGEPNHGMEVGGSSVWYSWTAPASGGVKLNVTGIPSALIGVYTGTQMSALKPIQSTASFPDDFDVVASTTYQIAVDVERGLQGTFTLALVFNPTIVRPPNDNFANRISVSGFTEIFGSNTNATREFGEPYNFGNKSVWWEWASPITGQIMIDPGKGVVHSLAVYSGTQLTNLVELGSSLGQPVMFHAIAGTKYELAVDAWEGNGGIPYGPIDLLISQGPQPVNDNFADRQVITGTNISISADTTGASREPGEPIHGLDGNHSVWYSWTAPADGAVYLQASGFNLVMLLGVYSGNTLPTLTQLATGAGYNNAVVWLPVKSGQTYHIAIDNPSDTFGGFTLQLTYYIPPINDNFANRIPVTGGAFHLNASNLGATREPGEAGDFYAGATIPGTNSLWWTWTAPSSGQLWVNGSTTFSSFISLYTGSSINTLQPVQRNVYFYENWFPVVAGTTYQISLDGYGQGGAGIFGTVSYDLWIVGPPANDNFANRQFFSGLTNLVYGFNSSATAEAGEPNPSGVAIGKSLWYSWTAPDSGNYRLSLENSDFGAASVVSVYTGSALNNLTFIAGAANPGTVVFKATAGTTYNISVDTSGAQSIGIARLTLRRLADNDMFADALPITGTNCVVAGDNTDATTEPGENPQGNGHTVWYAWTAPQSGRVHMTGNSEFTQVDVYRGNSVSNLTLIADPPFSPDFTARIGETFQIGIDCNYGNHQYGFTLTQAPAPPNDDFANAILLNGPTVQAYGTNVGATLEPGEPRFADSNATSTLWWKWTAPVSCRMRAYGQMMIDFGIGQENVAVYAGNSVSNLTRLAVGTNAATFSASAGTTYYICADAAGGALGTLFLDLQPTPPNDEFADRQVLSGYSVQANGTSAGGTFEPGENFHGIDPETASVWFTWTAPASGTLNINYSSVGFYASVSIYTGSSIATLSRITGSDFDFSFSVPVTKGTTYQIALAGWYGGGDYTLNLNLDAGNSNDAFANRIALAGTNFTVTANNSSATKQSGEPSPLGFAPSHSLWWTYTPPTNGSLRIDFSGVSFTPLIGVYTGSALSKLKPVTNVLDYLKREIVFNVSPKTNYQISIDGYNNAVGGIFLKFDFQPAPINDQFTNRLMLVGDSISTNSNNRGATEESSEPKHAGLIGNHSLWWSWTAPATETVMLAVKGDSFPARFAVYSGTVLKTLKPVASNYVADVLMNDLTFLAQKGSNYQIAVDSSFADFGAISLNLSTFPRPPNDDFADAIPLEHATMPVAGSNVGATSEAGEPNHGDLSPIHSVWWKWTAGVNGPVTIDTFGSTFDTVLAVYRGSNLTNLVPVASNDDAANGGSASEVAFDATAGQTYFVAVDGFSGVFGDIHLNLSATQPQPLQIGDIKVTQEGHFTFQIQGAPTQFFMLQSSTDLVNWENVSTNQCNDSVFEFSEPAISGAGAKFYRVVPWP